MSLTESQKKSLRGLGHTLDPVVTIGNAGLTEAVQREFDTSIAHHELIKVKVRVGDRKLRDEIIDTLCSAGGADLVTRIGNVALVYRRNEDNPRIDLTR